MHKIGRGGLYGRPQPGPASRRGTMVPPVTGSPVGAHCICALTAPPEPGGLRKSQACTGGYIIRPYVPASGPLVGAHCICALTAPPEPGGLRKSQACTGGHTGRPYAPPRRGRCPHQPAHRRQKTHNSRDGVVRFAVVQAWFIRREMPRWARRRRRRSFRPRVRAAAAATSTAAAIR